MIQYDKKYQGIILNLLGRTVIVEDMDTAISLAKQNSYTFKIVTIEGDIVSTTGSMSGGSINKKTVKILGRSKEIEALAKKIHIIKQNQEELNKEKENIMKESSEILKTSSELESLMQTIDIKFNVEKQKIDTINENIEKIKKNVDKLKKEREEIENQKKQYLEQIESQKKIKSQIEDENIKLREKIEEFTSENKETSDIVDALNLDITNLKISVSSFNESEISIDEMADILRNDIENQNKNIENKLNQIEKIKNDQQKLEMQIQNSTEKITDIKSKVSNSSSEIEKMKKQRAESNMDLSSKEKEEVDEFKIIEDLKAQIVKLDVKKTKIDDDLNEVINNLWNEYELTPNNCGGYLKPENVSLTTRRVNNLRTDIKELGGVNVDSIEEYKNLKQRYDFMCEQRLDLENTMAKLRDMIADITENMKIQFKEKMDIINTNFGETFKQLFGGGEARIVLQDDSNILECGIDIIAQPPGKKLQNMLLLSGGERAFTAIALLFAILRMNPAPFCVLDEIEAALDDVNVNRYAEFLKKFSDGTQFLVITHRKGTMEAADTVYGVTMEEKGISKLLSMKLKNE